MFLLEFLLSFACRNLQRPGEGARSLELEFYTVVYLDMGFENQTWVLCKISKYSAPEPSRQSSVLASFKELFPVPPNQSIGRILKIVLFLGDRKHWVGRECKEKPSGVMSSHHPG